MSDEAQRTTDHESIRRWAEERGGKPAAVAATAAGDDPGILRIEFPDRGDDERLSEISWDDFFEKFEEKRLAFLYQDRLKGGELSRFFKFVRRDGD